MTVLNCYIVIVVCMSWIRLIDCRIRHSKHNPLLSQSPYCIHNHDAAIDTNYHMHRVDSRADHRVHLVRGGQITTDQHTLNYSDTVRQLYKVLPHIAQTYDNLYIIDINLLNIGKSEGDSIRAHQEYQYFEHHDNHGQFKYWQILGTDINATDLLLQYDTDYSKYLVQHLDDFIPDSLITRVDTLYNMVHKQHYKHENTVIYVHCICGCDRTGELIGSYSMRYLHHKFKQVNYDNTLVPGRPMGCNNFLAMQWYCMFVAEKNSQGTQSQCLEKQYCM